MARKPRSLKSWLTPRLRRISMWWPEINKARDKAKVYIPIGFYGNGKPIIKRYFLCQAPDCGVLCEENEGAVDHIHPVVDVDDGFVDWNIYIPGLFCNSDNLQYLCHTCHDIKTLEENKLRNKG